MAPSRPLRSSAASKTALGGSLRAISMSGRMNAAKPVSEVRDRVARLALSPAASTAPQSVVWCDSAQARSSSNVFSPIPRAGTLTIRSSATRSAELRASRT